MAPKKRRGEEPERETVQHTFLSQEARERYRRSLIEKRCIPERGFQEPMKALRHMIEARNWGEFTKQPPAALIPVVREFYVNARESTDCKALVRGKWVFFNSQTINRVYNLPQIGEDAYSEWKSIGPDLEEVIQFLAKPGTEWSRPKGIPRHFPLSRMRAAGKVWHHFISAKLMPSNHLTEVTKERALLNYAIQKGMSIDVGIVIQSSIMNIAKGLTHSGGLGHPSLIYELCLREGVPTRSIEEIQHPKPPITQKVIRRITGNDDSDDPATGGRAARQRESSPGPSTSQPHARKRAVSKIPSDVAYLDRRMSDMQSALDQLGQNVTSLLDQQKYYWEQQAQQFTYMAEVQATLATVLAQQQQQGGEPIQLPQAPVFRPYSASGKAPAENDPEDEEENDEDDEDEEDDDDEEGSSESE